MCFVYITNVCVFAIGYSIIQFKTTDLRTHKGVPIDFWLGGGGACNCVYFFHIPVHYRELLKLILSEVRADKVSVILIGCEKIATASLVTTWKSELHLCS